LRSSLRKASVGALVLASVAGISGCASTVATKEIGSCKNYVLQIDPAKASVQQSARGASLQWGIYVSDAQYKSALFVLSVYAGGVKLDGKRQSYEPHGSLNSSQTAKYAGELFELKGTATQGVDTLSYDIKCKIL